MSSFRSLTPFALLFGLALAWCSFGFAGEARAQEAAAQEEGEEEEEKRKGWGRESRGEDPYERAPQVGPRVRERYEKALNHYFEEQYDEAQKELDRVYLNRLNPAEQALIHEAYAYLANAREERVEARRRLAAAAATVDDLGVRPDKALDLRYQIALLHVQDQNWTEAAKAMEAWFRDTATAAEQGVAKPANPLSYYMLALTYYQLEEYDKAVVPARTAVEKGEPPKEGWLQLLLGIYLLEKKYEESIPVLEQLVSLYPGKTHFMNLSTVYGALGRLEEAAVPLQLAYEGGFLTTDADLRRLGQLLLYLGLPYRSARLLELGMEEERLEPDIESLSMIGNSWIAAREFEASIAPLEQAASLSEDGELYVRLAQVHVQRENWDGATDALRKGIEKGDLEDPGGANLLMGIAFYSQERRTEARRWFQRATAFENTRGEARVWVTHVDQEIAELQAAAAEAAAEAEAAAAAAGG